MFLNSDDDDDDDDDILFQLVTQSFSPGENFPTMVFNSNSQGARTVTLYLGDFSMSNVTSVHVTVSVAGVVFQETLDNNKNDLFMELFWNKTDVYGNKVYGLTEVQAMIEVSLLGCSEKFWVTSIRSEVEGLSCHDSISYQHHYCLTKGDSLYTGRGHAFHLSKYPPVMRHMQCLNPPKVIESLPNGDLLIGDNTQIFHVRGGKIGNRCELNYAVYSFGSSGISDDVEYFIAVDSSSEFFYLSRTDSPVITKVFIKSRTEQVVLGKQGEYCTDGIHNCKDTLKSPKGKEFFVFFHKPLQQTRLNPQRRTLIRNNPRVYARFFALTTENGEEFCIRMFKFFSSLLSTQNLCKFSQC